MEGIEENARTRKYKIMAKEYTCTFTQVFYHKIKETHQSFRIFLRCYAPESETMVLKQNQKTKTKLKQTNKQMTQNQLHKSSKLDCSTWVRKLIIRNYFL